MTRLVHIERQFTTRAQAESWFDTLRRTAWPYVWCMKLPQGSRWRVAALVEEPGGASTARFFVGDAVGLRLAEWMDPGSEPPAR